MTDNKNKHNETPPSQRHGQYRQYWSHSRRNRFAGTAVGVKITQCMKKHLQKKVYGKKHENRS